MYKVLIVDDEPVVREGMKQIIDWQNLGFDLIGTAANGNEALQMMKSQEVDIVITDIRMPEIDGIELIKLIRENDYHCEFIIVSGYSEFTYAKEAIHQGVSSYLLKPIDEKELILELEKLASKIENNRQKSQSYDFYQEYSNINQLKEFIIYGIYEEQIELHYNADEYHLLKIDSNVNGMSHENIIKAIKTIAEMEIIHFNHGAMLYYLFTDFTYAQILKIIQQLIEQDLKFSRKLSFILSQSTHDFKQLSHLYQEIKDLSQKKYMYPNLNILSLESIAEYKESLANQIEIDKADINTQLFEAIKHNQKEIIHDLLVTLNYYYTKNDWREAYIKADLASMFTRFAEELEDQINHPLKEDQKRYIVSIILNEQSLHQTFEFLNAIFNDFSRFFDAAKDKHDIVAEMKEYTKKNYHRNITLMDISNELNYSYSYIGKKFRAEEKVSYRTYLDSVRIEQAKWLLSTQQYLVYEIAEKVGYNNSDYFYKKFKSIVGMSPSDYQKQFEIS
ncbi:response regulator transcription factor [Fundicoccus sp. Sow4_H7]|uniref:response regulator transcription factor n=1 Tax=Fundicoccus sp. Sow4_H7 TaxID=3438784 RepID=UPI003F907608